MARKCAGLSVLCESELRSCKVVCLVSPPEATAPLLLELHSLLLHSDKLALTLMGKLCGK